MSLHQILDRNRRKLTGLKKSAVTRYCHQDPKQRRTPNLQQLALIADAIARSRPARKALVEAWLEVRGYQKTDRNRDLVIYAMENGCRILSDLARKLGLRHTVISEWMLGRCRPDPRTVELLQYRCPTVARILR